MASTLRTHVHGRVFWQLVIFAVVCVGLLAAVAVDAFEGAISLWWVAGAFIVGLGVGFVVGRMFALRWHEDTRKVVMSLDRTSIVVIIAYIAFRIFGEQFLGQYVQGTALSATTFALLAGILLGRLWSVSRGVRKILREQGIW